MFEGSLSFSFNQIQILCVSLQSNKTLDYKGRNFRKEFESKDTKKEGIIKSQNILIGIPHFIDRQPASVERMTRIVQAKMKVMERRHDGDQ